MPNKQTPASLRLPTYLAGAAGSAAFLMAPQAEAAVTAVNFGFGTTLSTATNASGNATVGPGFGTVKFTHLSYYGDLYVSLGFAANNSSNFEKFYQSNLVDNVGTASFFTTGTLIGAGGNGILGLAYFYSSISSRGFASDQLDKNIAFQTSTGHWGWANVSWTDSTKTLAINSAYVESVAGNPITVGDVGAVPEPSRTLLALAGLGGVALRRRRRQSV